MNSFWQLEKSFPNLLLVCSFLFKSIYYFAVTSSFLRSSQRRFPRAVSCRNPNGEESVSNKVEDGNTMPFIGKSGGADCFGIDQQAPHRTHVISSCSFSSLPRNEIFSSPEPHILLFRRPLGTDPQSGRVDPEMERKAREEYLVQYGRK